MQQKTMKYIMKQEARPFRIPASIAEQLPRTAAAFSVRGNCMEGRQIYDGDIIMADLERMPRAGDPCVCISNGQLMIKTFLSVHSEGIYIVGTQYDFRGKGYRDNEDGSRMFNGATIAEEIGGVVVACFDSSGDLRWIKDYQAFPFKLPPIHRQKPQENLTICKI